MSSHRSYHTINSKPFFIYDNEDICKWIQSINLDFYLNKFKTNKITGADLCYLNNDDIKAYLEIDNLNDRYSLLREIKMLTYTKIKFNLYFIDQQTDLNLDFDINITLEKIFPLICNVLNLNKVSKHLFKYIN